MFTYMLSVAVFHTTAELSRCNRNLWLIKVTIFSI